MREIRRGQSDDLPALTGVFWRSVREGAAPRYSAAERAAWLPERPEAGAFSARLSGQTIFVCEISGEITGFITLTDAGYIDFVFVSPEARGTGVADDLLAMVLNRAAARGMSRLTTRASDMARSFFARHGWSVIGPAPLVRDTLTLAATDMALDLCW